MAYAVEARRVEAQPSVAIRRRVTPAEIPGVMQEALPRLFAHVGAKGGEPVAVYARHHEMTADRFEMEVGVTTRGRIAGEAEIMSSELPACEAAYTLHEGPYEDLSAAYEAIEQWMRANGRAPAGGPWEVYLNSPQEEPDPTKLKTEMYWPVV